MELQLWLAFIGASIAISVSPGAGAILSMATGLSHGVRRTYWSILGLQIGLMTQLALVAVGLGALVASSVLAFTVVKWLGVLYLVYLAVRQWRSAAMDLESELDDVPVSTRRGLVVRGALVNLTNPKGLVFLLAVLPQFVVPTAPLTPQYLAIGVTMVVVDLAVMGGYAALAARLMRWLKTPRQQRAVNRTFSGLFAAAAVGLSLMRRAATT
ncbi:homoserine/homoserine lactone efflux protein [Mycolicibacterium confluentis]|nr:homoserine/homoserine lactone efflux protein [Mycolicibacterium confluentis]MCV7322017.1 homoserine/homoserine lactone efflux protein [Mycolicibacterium confluentis]ORV32252.1 threonine transporter RhtB [Mycolicibacterium confluentis]